MMTQTTSRTDKKCPSWGLLILSNIVVFAIAGLFFSHPMIWTPESISYASLSSLAVISENEEREPLSYIPSPIESYFLDHGVELGLNVERPEPSGCTDWKSKTSPIASELAAFRSALRVYNAKMAAFPGTVKDLRQHISTNHSICDTLNLHPEGLKGIFPSGTLTQTSHGLLEPLFPPMRHPDFCFDGRSALMSLDYLVHDFSSYCRKLKPTSRTVLVDLGASLDFHGKKTSPAIYLTESFQRFGFHFDHIYAFEISKKEPEEVFQRIPQDLLAAYHWINVGVNSEHNSTRNPWNMIRKSYNEDDFVVIKLDIDTSWIEVPLANQILESPELLKLVDAFYFEHHVHLLELRGDWGGSMSGSIYDSIKLFTDFRKAGVDAHFWV